MTNKDIKTTGLSRYKSEERRKKKLGIQADNIFWKKFFFFFEKAQNKAK